MQQDLNSIQFSAVNIALLVSSKCVGECAACGRAVRSECEASRDGVGSNETPRGFHLLWDFGHTDVPKEVLYFSCCWRPSACVQLMLDAVAETAEVALFWPRCLRNRLRAARRLGDGLCWRRSDL